MADLGILEDRRNRLVKQLRDGDIAIIGSGTAPMRSLDEAYPFSVDRNFYYLTGIDRENMILVCENNKGKAKVTLYIERFDEVMAKWVGARMLPEEAEDISGIEDVRYLDEYEDDIASYVYRKRMQDTRVYLDLWRDNTRHTASFGLRQADLFRKEYPECKICDIYKLMTELRMIKDETEIEDIVNAIKATGEAIKAMLKASRAGINECELEGAFDYALAKQGRREYAFKTIVAGGKRATTLHYSDNDEIVSDGELVLIDLGCTYNHYSADISRAFPVNGKFTKRQAEIYEVVRKGGLLVIENAKEGKTVKQLNDMLLKYYKKELKRLSILEKDEDVSEYYYHNVSHQLGLDTHDLSYGSDIPLKAGMVITVEPGLYIEKENIGIRIEDDVLITKDGARVLSDMIPKTIDEIESIMREK